MNSPKKIKLRILKLLWTTFLGQDPSLLHLCTTSLFIAIFILIDPEAFFKMLKTNLLRLNEENLPKFVTHKKMLEIGFLVAQEHFILKMEQEHK